MLINQRSINPALEPWTSKQSSRPEQLRNIISPDATIQKFNPKVANA
jgi:hypothetical protein